MCCERQNQGRVSVYMYIPRNLREKFNLFVPGTVYEKKLEITGLSFADNKEMINLAEIMRLSWPVEKSPNFDDVAFRKTIDIGLKYLEEWMDEEHPEPPQELMYDFELVITEFINQYFCFITAVAQPYIVEERTMERENSVGQMVMCPKFIHRQLLGCEKAYAHLNFKSYRKMHSRRSTLMSPFELRNTNI